MSLSNLIQRMPLYFDIFRATLRSDSKHRLPYEKRCFGVINILGTGPSLNSYIDKILKNGDEESCFALNDLAVSDIFEKIKPRFYILIDPAYFLPRNSISQRDEKNRSMVFNKINNNTQWPMEIVVPAKFFKEANCFIKNPNVSLLPVSFGELTLIDCPFYYSSLRKNIAASFQNVLAAAVYVSINLGFDEIRLFGAEHSWPKDIRVNDDNQVCTVYRHFYGEEEKLVPWLDFNKRPFSMQEIMMAMYKTFRAYGLLAKYATMNSCKIFNYTPGSFIDAFERKILL